MKKINLAAGHFPMNGLLISRLVQKLDHSRPLFLYFCLLNTVDSKYKMPMTGCEPQSLVLEVTAQPTELHPLPNFQMAIPHKTNSFNY